MEERTHNDDRNYLSYIKYNYYSILLHLISSIVMLFLYIEQQSAHIPYTTSYSRWNRINRNYSCPLGSRYLETSSGNFCIEKQIKTVNRNDSNDSNDSNDNNDKDIYWRWLIISFHILSFVFQGIAELTIRTGHILGYNYNEMISNGRNPLRFIEYSFSASIMLISIALLNGIIDINLIISIEILTTGCQLCVLVVEYIEENKTKILVHLIGWLQFCWAYLIIIDSFITSIQESNNNLGTQRPTYVYIIVIILFLLYSSFGLVQLSELIVDINPYTKETLYVILSLTSKLILGWMIFSNVLLLSN